MVDSAQNAGPYPQGQGLPAPAQLYEKRVDPSTNRPYWYNWATGQSSWDPPAVETERWSGQAQAQAQSQTYAQGQVQSQAQSQSYV